MRSFALRLSAALAAGLMLALLALPLAALLLHVPPRRLAARLADPVVLDALRLSLLTSLSATAAVVGLGLPLAWLLATRRFRGKRLLELLVDLPMVLPPTLAGLALLLAFGRAGLAGRAFKALGFSLPFTTAGVVVAQVFMSAPFFIVPVRAGLASVERRYVDAAATLRADPLRTFFGVLLPLARPALLAGTAMSCARALGEFGATITFVSNIPGETQTISAAIYTYTNVPGGDAAAGRLVLVAIAISLAALIISEWFARRAGTRFHGE
jgi:molybdate transport system permease protein